MSGPAVADLPVATYLTALASTASVPGGGSAAAVAGAMGCALIGMVARISMRKVSSEADRTTLEQLAGRADELVSRLAALSQEDIDAFRAVLDARKRAGDAGALPRAYQHAAEVPLQTAQAAAEGLALVARLRPLAWSLTASDAEAANHLLGAALRTALANVEVNLPELGPDGRGRIEPEFDRLRALSS